MSEILKTFIERVCRQNINVLSVVLANGDGLLNAHYFVPDERRSVYSIAKSYLTTKGELCKKALLTHLLAAI